MAKRFFISRLNLSTKFNLLNDGFKLKRDILEKTLKNLQQNQLNAKNNSYYYEFADITSFIDSNLNDEIFHGFVFRLSTQHETVDRGRTYPNITEKPIAKGKFEFFLIVKSGLLFYSTIHGFSNETCGSTFAKLFRHNLSNQEIEIAVYKVNQQNSVIDNLKRFKRINKMEITLLPSNPNYLDDWKDVDDEMKALGLSSQKVTYNSKTENGIMVGKTAEELKQTSCGKQLLMAEDGYGIAKIVGLDEYDKIKNVENDVAQESVEDIPTDLNHQGRFNYVYEFARKVFDRFKH